MYMRVVTINNSLVIVCVCVYVRVSICECEIYQHQQLSKYRPLSHIHTYSHSHIHTYTHTHTHTHTHHQQLARYWYLCIVLFSGGALYIVYSCTYCAMFYTCAAYFPVCVGCSCTLPPSSTLSSAHLCTTRCTELHP